MDKREVDQRCDLCELGIAKLTTANACRKRWQIFEFDPLTAAREFKMVIIARSADEMMPHLRKVPRTPGHTLLVVPGGVV